MLRNNRGQWSLVELLVVVALIAILICVVYPRAVGHHEQTRKSVAPTAPADRAREVQCMANLRQVRAAIVMYVQSNEDYPQTLEELRPSFLSGSQTQCPVTGRAYSYDAVAGRVWCTSSGHGGY
jgi:Tfp pilus assembly protein PilE